MRTPASRADVERVAALSGLIHGSGIADLTLALVDHFPGMQPADLVYVEEEASQQVVSTLCLIPWTIRYGPAELRVGEMGIVGTAEAYQGRGLVRAQVEHFRARLSHHGCVLSLIQGIPYFYRQFGYTYALPLEGGIRLDGHELPAEADHPFTFRRATPGDIPAMAAFYTAAAQELTIASVRDAATWEYLLGPLQGTELSCELWMVEAADGTPVGYLRLPDHHFHADLAVSEVSRLAPDAALATLQRCAGWARERGKPGVRLNLPEQTPMVKIARHLGAHDQGRYAWQVQMPDLALFLTAIAPALEARLAASPLAGWSGEVPINLFRTGATLRFAGGRLTAAPAAGAQWRDINFPPDAFLPVALGWRSFDEVRHLFPDAHVEGRLRLLFETLFPTCAGFLYTCT
jgi:hypothetical protein